MVYEIPSGNPYLASGLLFLQNIELNLIKFSCSLKCCSSLNEFLRYRFRRQDIISCAKYARDIYLKATLPNIFVKLRKRKSIYVRFTLFNRHKLPFSSVNQNSAPTAKWSNLGRVEPHIFGIILYMMTH